ncbi:Sf3a2-prov protein [Rhizobium rhizogenes]|uniref:Sf3a2-prov protein n=1 Tax=Rhizobium rhizogenes TaxID=359 RepID=UPI001571D3DD|nr:Sf3a2-prov protein [Rhizobium rhizogenes]NTF46141.1 Sf3a2-prov protein [Rhizobium rhizogenes]
MAKPDKPQVSSGSDAKHTRKSNAGAYERGAKAGKQKNPEDGNPYPEGSPAAKSFEHGQLDAQKVRSNDKPPGR